MSCSYKIYLCGISEKQVSANNCSMFQRYEAALVLLCGAHIPSKAQATVFFTMCICLKLVFVLNYMCVVYFGGVCIHFRVYVPYTHICVRNASSNTDPKHTEKINNKSLLFFGTFRNNQKIIASKGYLITDTQYWIAL